MPAQHAARWFSRQVVLHGRSLQCAYCASWSRQSLLCGYCDLAVCRGCLGIGEQELFDVGFQCVACAVVALPLLEVKPDWAPQLLTLQRAKVITLASRLKPSTWMQYQRWVTEIQHFMIDSGVIIFPILSSAVASAFTLFLQYLKGKGYSWGTIRQCRSAVAAFHKSIPGISAEEADPFTRFPEMSLMWSGINRTVLTSVTPRRPLPGVWVIAVIKLLHQRFREGLAERPRQARLDLRNALILAFGFFGIRRSAELFVNKSRRMGLLRSHVTVTEGQSVNLYIQSQKNDTTAKGNLIHLSWVTQSGVCLGDMVTDYVGLLAQDGIPADSPFFLPTSRVGTFVSVEPGSVSKLNYVIKQLISEFYPGVTEQVLKEYYSFHSLRRGGATWARSRGVPLGLIIALGLWTTVDGARSYLVPSEEEKTLASFLM